MDCRHYSISLLTLLTFVTLNARADERRSRTYGEGSIGAGASVGATSETGASGSVNARLGVKLTGTMDSIVYWLDAEATYNAIGGGPEGVSTGGSAHLEGLIAGHLLPNHDGTCAFYGGASILADGSLHFQRSYMNGATVFAGAETGLICRFDTFTMMASPSVGIGAATVTKAFDQESFDAGLNSKQFLHLSGRMRALIGDTAAFSAAFSHMPDVKGDNAYNHTVYAAQLNGEFKLNDDWVVGLRGRVLHLEPVAANPDKNNPNQNTVTNGEGGVSASMTF